ncbi:DUF4177 domain-containing protein [Hymenobacter setariae]|uniref:DUF4177 domain-containing protein n=2 Tax=Hymenobacter setariae TaxID=2594794 RepID=A0A558C2H3_9BACT|nr:DUF4177 domain-containing protein [Hymenobacter setariae]
MLSGCRRYSLSLNRRRSKHAGCYMKKFEYKLLDTRSGFFSGFDYKQLNEHLNQLGALGWEMVAMVSVTTAGTAASFLITLKREIQ